MNEKQREIETIKPREYSLKLSDADVMRIAKIAGAYDMTVSELLENFIGDLVNGTYTNGSDERMYARNWVERCWFSYAPDKSLVKYLCDDKREFEFSDLWDALERIEDAREDIRSAEENIAEPGEKWKEIYHHKYNEDKTEAWIPAYNSVEEYIASETEVLKSYEEDLKESLETLEDIKNSFKSYMNEKAYEWDEEVKKAEEWYKENIAKKLGD